MEDDRKHRRGIEARDIIRTPVSDAIPTEDVIEIRVIMSAAAKEPIVIFQCVYCPDDGMVIKDGQFVCSGCGYEMSVDNARYVCERHFGSITKFREALNPNKRFFLWRFFKWLSQV